MEVVEEVVIMVVVVVNQVMHLLMELAAVVRVQSIAMVVPDKLIQVVEALVQTNQVQEHLLINKQVEKVDPVLW